MEARSLLSCEKQRYGMRKNLDVARENPEITSFLVGTDDEEEEVHAGDYDESDEALHNAVAAAESRLARKLLRIRLLENRLAEKAADEKLLQLEAELDAAADKEKATAEEKASVKEKTGLIWLPRHGSMP